MFNKFSQQSITFKLVHLIVFGAMFFVQTQLGFIERAYGKESLIEYSFKKQTSTHSANHAIASDHSKDSKYSKLNKRYPLAYTFLGFSPEQIAQPSFAFAHLQSLYTSPFGIDNFNNAFSLRGPPVSFLS